MAIQQGDCVRLKQDFAAALAGSEGVVTFVDAVGNLNVTIERGPDCQPMTIVLPAAPRDRFEQPCRCG